MHRPRKPVPFAVPDIGDGEIRAVIDALRSGWVTTGPRVGQFERAFAAAVGARHAVAVSSCTAALHLALEALGVGPGDEVVTTPYTFTATAAVVEYLGARPVFADIDPISLNVHPMEVARRITPRTKAVVVVHFGGLPADVDQIRQVTAAHGVALVEDAAHAFPARYRGRPIGCLGDVTCFSFYATKCITTGEGGMLCTDDDRIAERARVMRLHGMTRDAWKRYTAEGSWFYEVVAPGYKYNMTDLQAALGLVQLERAEQMRRRREEIAHRYTEAFRECPALEPPPAPDGDGTIHAWHLYPLRLNLERLRLDRNAFIEELRARGIGTSVHFIPLHIHPYYRDKYGLRPDDYPVAYREYLREVSLPIYSRMTDADVAVVVETVLDVARNHMR